MELLMLGRHTQAELVPKPSAFKVEMAIEKLKRHKSTGIDKIPAELIKHGAEQFALRSTSLLIQFEIRRNLPEEWKESIMVPIYKKGDKRKCNNYGGISLLSSMYRILSNILLSRLTPYADEIIGDHQCEFQCNRSTTDHIFCIHQILEKKWQLSSTSAISRLQEGLSSS